MFVSNYNNTVFRKFLLFLNIQIPLRNKYVFFALLFFKNNKTKHTESSKNFFVLNLLISLRINFFECFLFHKFSCCQQWTTINKKIKYFIWWVQFWIFCFFLSKWQLLLKILFSTDCRSFQVSKYSKSWTLFNKKIFFFLEFESFLKKEHLKKNLCQYMQKSFQRKISNGLVSMISIFCS